MVTSEGLWVNGLLVHVQATRAAVPCYFQVFPINGLWHIGCHIIMKAELTKLALVLELLNFLPGKIMYQKCDQSRPHNFNEWPIREQLRLYNYKWLFSVFLI